MNSKSGHIQSAAIVGAGNVGTALAVALRRAGVEVRAVWSRCAANAEALARRVEAVASADLRSMSERADVCIIAVSDNAIADVAQRLAQGPATVVHTSGGTSIDVLRRFEHRGVVYPFQTFSKGVDIGFGRVPVMVEAIKFVDLDAPTTNGGCSTWPTDCRPRRCWQAASCGWRSMWRRCCRPTSRTT